MAVLAWVAIGDVQAQTMTQAERRARVDSVLAARYYRTPYDTNYVVRPEGKLTLKVRINQTGNAFHAKGTVNGIYSKADLSTSHKTMKFVEPVYQYMNETESRVPTSDWYDTKTGLMIGFKARSVIGGFWMKVLMDKMGIR